MTDRPIIFSAPMIRALLENRKTMTRRLAARPDGKPSPWQRVKPGDRLWCREAHLVYPMGGTQVCAYQCTDTSGRRGPWRPSIHMPRWASRLTLIVTAAKIERLQEIRHAEARAEGCQPAQHRGPQGGRCDGDSTGLDDCYRCGFHNLWNTLHGAGAWEANPEVVALTFTVNRANIDTLTTEGARER